MNYEKLLGSQLTTLKRPKSNSQKGLTTFLIQNFKTMSLWVFILIWYSISHIYLMWDLDSYLKSEHITLKIILVPFKHIMIYLHVYTKQMYFCTSVF